MKKAQQVASPTSGRTTRIPGPPGTGLGIVVALVVLMVGIFLAQAPREWTAYSDLLVVPDAERAGSGMSSYYETLSQGQVPGTAAAIMENPALVRRAAEAANIPLSEVSVSASVVPDTSLVRITTTAPDETSVVLLTEELARISIPEVRGMLSPYGVVGLGQADQTVRPSGLTTAQTLGVAALMALAAGAGVQQAAQQLAAARRRRRLPPG